MSDRDDALREQLVWLLKNEHAHVGYERAFADLPAHLRGARSENIPHTPWWLLEHMRIAQHDILEFCRRPEHVSPDWPEGYWPDGDAPPNAQAWEQSFDDFARELEAMCALIGDPAHDLHAPFPHGDGQTLLREALLLADHNAYHLGQVVAVRRALGAWED